MISFFSLQALSGLVFKNMDSQKPESYLISWTELQVFLLSMIMLFELVNIVHSPFLYRKWRLFKSSISPKFDKLFNSTFILLDLSSLTEPIPDQTSLLQWFFSPVLWHCARIPFQYTPFTFNRIQEWPTSGPSTPLQGPFVTFCSSSCVFHPTSLNCYKFGHYTLFQLHHGLVLHALWSASVIISYFLCHEALVREKTFLSHSYLTISAYICMPYVIPLSLKTTSSTIKLVPFTILRVSFVLPLNFWMFSFD